MWMRGRGMDLWYIAGVRWTNLVVVRPLIEALTQHSSKQAKVGGHSPQFRRQERRGYLQNFASAPD